MKKLIIFSALALSFASCRKDFECTCVTSNGSASSSTKTILVYVTKKTAKANCVSSAWTDAAGTNYTKTCTLD